MGPLTVPCLFWFWISSPFVIYWKNLILVACKHSRKYPRGSQGSSINYVTTFFLLINSSLTQLLTTFSNLLMHRFNFWPFFQPLNPHEKSWHYLWTAHSGRTIFELATLLNPVWHGIGKQEKCSSLKSNQGATFVGLMSSTECPNLSISIFTSKRDFDKESADKIWCNKDNGIKNAMSHARQGSLLVYRASK